MGTGATVPEPPQALLYYKMCESMHIQLVDGGVFDQPHIWLLEYAICQKKTELFDQQNKSGQAVPPTMNDKFAQDYPAPP